MERMFERDKDELRNMGVEIEVKGLDPLFEDDQGYLIRAETFQLNGNEFAADELLYLTMAANLWHDSALSNDSKAALLKIQSLSGPIEFNAINSPVVRDSESSQMLATAFEAIEKLKKLSFKYNGNQRSVEPLGMFMRSGFWYLVAQDDKVVKSFKLVRVESKISIEERTFIKPEGFDLTAYLERYSEEEIFEAEILVRKEQAYSLRSKYSVKEHDSEWDLMFIPYSYEPEIIENLLWHGQNIIVRKPQSLRDSIVSRLEEFIDG
jgi:proteasome accessory factor B